MPGILTPLSLLLLTFFALSAQGQTYLRPDGNTDNTYNLINKVLGGGKSAAETPDCDKKHHKSFGDHITQVVDESSDPGRFVFAFHLHVTPDDDRCNGKNPPDRQRNEIKTFGPSPDYLKGFQGETVTYSWGFKLDSGFRPSKSFTHIHQIKAADGSNSGSPIITITPRKNSKSGTMQILHKSSKSGAKATPIKETDLKPFLGEWIQVSEQLTYDTKGKYSVTLTRVRDGKKLLSVTSDNIDLWRQGTSFVRPKWGIYRSLTDKKSLRDEVVYFDQFCLAKGDDNCE